MALPSWNAGWRKLAGDFLSPASNIFVECRQHFLLYLTINFHAAHHFIPSSTFQALYACTSTSSVPYYFRPILRAFIMRHNKCFSHSMLLWLLSIYSSFISYFREYFWYFTVAQLANLWWMPKSVSIGFGTAMKTDSSRRFKRYYTTYMWVGFPLLWIRINQDKP